jgi:hypothetical protein
MITFSSFVSSLTNSMTMLRRMNEASNAQQTVLRRYLKDCSVSTSLKVRVLGWLQAHADNTKCRLHSRDVKLLSLLPETMISDLQDECLSPITNKHPLFFQVHTGYHRLMRRVFPTITESAITVGRELFGPADNANKMYFLVKGALVYSYDVHHYGHLVQNAGGMDQNNLDSLYWAGAKKKHGDDDMPKGQIIKDSDATPFLSEAALWVLWSHQGSTVAVISSELVEVNASAFLDMMCTKGKFLWQVPRYASLFADALRHGGMRALSDLPMDYELLADFAQQAFDDEDEEPVIQPPSERASVLS